MNLSNIAKIAAAVVATTAAFAVQAADKTCGASSSCAKKECKAGDAGCDAKCSKKEASCSKKEASCAKK